MFGFVSNPWTRLHHGRTRLTRRFSFLTKRVQGISRRALALILFTLCSSAGAGLITLPEAGNVTIVGGGGGCERGAPDVEFGLVVEGKKEHVFTMYGYGCESESVNMGTFEAGAQLDFYLRHKYSGRIYDANSQRMSTASDREVFRSRRRGSIVQKIKNHCWVLYMDDAASSDDDDNDLSVTVCVEPSSASADEYVYVADGIRGQIKKFDTEGNLLLKWGRIEMGQQTPRGGVFRWDNPIGLHGIAVDRKGNVYVVDGGNGKIHKFDGDGKFLNFVEGEEVCSLQGGRWYRGRIVGAKKVCSRDFPRTSGAGSISGIAIDSADNLYIAVKERHEVQKIDAEGNFVLKFGKHSNSHDWSKEPPGGYFRHSGNMRSLGGIAIDSRDNVYVVDGADRRIQKFNSSGQFLKEITGLRSDTSPGMQGIAIDSKDNLYVAIGAAHQIFKFDSNDKLVRKWGKQGCGKGEFKRGGSGVSGVAVDGQDNVYVATAGACAHQVQKFDPNGKFIKGWGGFIGYSYGPSGLQGIAVGGVSSSSNQDSEEKECAGEEESEEYFVYVADTLNHRIQKFDSKGNFLLSFGNWGGRFGSGYKPKGGTFAYPYDIAADKEGNVYVVDHSNNRIQKFDSSGNFLKSWGNPNKSSSWGSGDLMYPTGVGVDGDGKVWVADHTNQLVKKYDSNGKLIETWPKDGTSHNPWFLGRAVSRRSASRHYIQTKTGRWRAMFLHPRDVAVDKEGNVYVLEFDRGRVQKLDKNGVFKATFGAPMSTYPDTACRGRAGCWNRAPGRFSMPRRIALDLDGNVLVSDSDRIQRFSSSGSLLNSWGRRGSRPGHFQGPTGLAVGPDGRVFVLDEFNHRLQIFDSKGEFDSQWGKRGQGDGEFNQPLGVAIGSGGGDDAPSFIVPYCEEDITGSGAPVTVDAKGGSGGTQLYLTQYSARDWIGDLKSFLIKDGGKPGGQQWSAAAKLDAGSANGSTRVLLTWGKKPDGKDADLDSEGAAFRWENLWASQKSDLRIEMDGSCGTVSSGKDRLEYLRGVESGKGLRKRKSLLGAIVHSRAIYVGNPILDWPGAEYAKFKTAHRDRTPIIYVGANDGALHGFSAKDGEEVIGYFPATLFDTGSKSGLHYFTNPDYKHRYLVDGTPAISDVDTRSKVTGKKAWRTVLVSTLRGGGRGLFAVDVTNPALFTEMNARSLVLWEFNNKHDAHLGYTFSEPTIAKMNNGRWAVILGNGYEDTAADKTGGQAQLFIIYVDGGIDGRWTEGKDYLRIPTGAGSPVSRNGLATPAVVDLDGNATVDRVYAGDLEGNLWAFDLSSKIPTEWKVAIGHKKKPQPLFQAWDMSALAQPITVKPEIIRNTLVSSAKSPNLLVLFGTGKYILDEDKTSKAPQTFYAVWDQGDKKLTRRDLAKQTILFETKRAAGRGRVTDPDLIVDYPGMKKRQYGWYLDLPTDGERVVSHPKVRFGTIYFNTLIPDPKDCGFGGTGWMMSVGLFNGGSPPAQTPVFDFNEDGAITIAGDTVEVRKERYAYAGKMFEKGGEPTGPSIIDTGGRHLRYTVGTETDETEKIEVNALREGDRLTGRISWQQVYHEIQIQNQ